MFDLNKLKSKFNEFTKKVENKFNQEVYSSPLSGKEYIYNQSETIQLSRQISQGSFSFVYDTNIPEYVAKVINVSSVQQAKQVVKEAYYQYVFSSQNQNIVKVYALFINQKQVKDMVNIMNNEKIDQLPTGEYVLLLEKCNKSLIQVLNELGNKRFLSEPVVVNYLAQICQGFSTIHNYNVINRDTKVENLLLHNNTVKICDFGSCTTEIFNDPQQFLKNSVVKNRLENEIQNNTTPQYRAPEMIDLYSRQPINQKSDVFAIGVILYRLMYKKLPFAENELLANFNVRYEFPDETDEFKKRGPYDEKDDVPIFSDNLKKIVRRCLTKNVNDRADIFELIDMMKQLGQKFAPYTEYRGQVHQPLLDFKSDQKQQSINTSVQQQGQMQGLSSMFQWQTISNNSTQQQPQQQVQQQTQQIQQTQQQDQDQQWGSWSTTENTQQPQLIDLFGNTNNTQQQVQQQSNTINLFQDESSVQISMVDFLNQWRQNRSQRNMQGGNDQVIKQINEILSNQSQSMENKIYSQLYLVETQSHLQKQFTEQQLQTCDQIFQQQVAQAKKFNNLQQLADLRILVTLFKIAQCYTRINCDWNDITQNESQQIQLCIKLHGGLQLLLRKTQNSQYDQIIISLLKDNFIRFLNNCKLLISDECIVNDEIKEQVKNTYQQTVQQEQCILGINLPQDLASYQ